MIYSQNILSLLNETDKQLLKDIIYILRGDDERLTGYLQYFISEKRIEIDLLTLYAVMAIEIGNLEIPEFNLEKEDEDIFSAPEIIELFKSGFLD